MDRIKNLSSDEICPDCADEGLAVAALRPSPDRPEPEYAYEEFGPCPSCERGFQVEFPPEPAVGPWGKSGYWRGRPATVISSPVKHPRLATVKENQAGIAMLEKIELRHLES
jgi:hypothetical protein